MAELLKDVHDTLFSFPPIPKAEIVCSERVKTYGNLSMVGFSKDYRTIQRDSYYYCNAHQGKARILLCIVIFISPCGIFSSPVSLNTFQIVLLFLIFRLNSITLCLKHWCLSRNYSLMKQKKDAFEYTK